MKKTWDSPRYPGISAMEILTHVEDYKFINIWGREVHPCLMLNPCNPGNLLTLKKFSKISIWLSQSENTGSLTFSTWQYHDSSRQYWEPVTSPACDAFSTLSHVECQYPCTFRLELSQPLPRLRPDFCPCVL